MNFWFSRDEYKKRNKSKAQIKRVKVEKRPDWFDQDIKENTATIDEIKALEERIGNR